MADYGPCATPGCDGRVRWKNYTLCPSCNREWNRKYNEWLSSVDNLIAIDLSTTGTCAVSHIAKENKIITCFDIPYDGRGYTARRNQIIETIQEYVTTYEENNSKKIGCFITERVRVRHQGYISLPTITTLVALTTRLVDHFSDYVFFDVDVRDWKGEILGYRGADKQAAVDYVKFNFGLDVNHDIADSICFGLYAIRDLSRLKKISDD